jgi:purine-binding chemotaxis protein CheW
MEATLATNDQAREDDLHEVLQERAKVLREVPIAEESGEKISILSFQLGEEVYGVELRDLTETRQSVPLRHLPSAPPHLPGIVNLRGELLPVIDLCPILGLPPQELNKTVPALLILSLKGNKFAFAVDRAKDILTLPLKEIHAAPLSLEPDHAVFIRGEFLADNRLISLLDMEKLLQDQRFFGVAHTRNNESSPKGKEETEK